MEMSWHGVHEPVKHGPATRADPRRTGVVARVEVDADGGRFHERLDTVHPRALAVLLVRLNTDQDARALPAGRLPGGRSASARGLPPRWSRRAWALVRVNDRRAALGGETDRLLRYSTLISGLQSGQCADKPDSFTWPVAGALDAQGVVEHGDAGKITRLAEEFAAPVHHGLTYS